MSFKNSFRVGYFSNSPKKAEVVVTEFCFCTPRIIIHKCFASITTATPIGFSAFFIASKICVVNLSYTCNLLEKTSTTLAILLKPVI